MTKPVGILAAALIAVGIVAAHLWVQLRDARGQLAALPARAELLQPAPIPSLVAAVTPASAEAVAAQNCPSAPPAAPSQTPQNPDAATAKLLAGLKQLSANPEYQEMNRSRVRASLPQMYPDLAKDLGLTPELANRLFDVLARQQSEPAAAEALDLLANGTPDRGAMQEMQRKARQKEQDHDTELAAVLGDKYQQWRDYESTPTARDQVNQLRAALGSGADALGDAQAKPLIAALSAEQGRINRETLNAELPATPAKDGLEQEMQHRTESDRRLVKAAQSVLTAQQLDGYKRMLEQKANMARTVLRSLSGLAAEDPNDPAAPR